MYLSEIFTSFQGEGPWAGIKQVFVRFAGCGLGCSYCDTPEARDRTPWCRVEKEAFQRDFYRRANPLEAAEVCEEVRRVWNTSYHSVSLTGGEPLEQPEDLAELMSLLAGAGMPIYLESNGTRPEPLARVVDLATIVSMDIKLDSSSGTGDLLERHAEFLQLTQGRPASLKAVITGTTNLQEAARVFAALANIRRDVPLVLQPVSATDNRAAPDFERLALFQRLAGDYFPDVRIIPQMHKYWKIA